MQEQLRSNTNSTRHKASDKNMFHTYPEQYKISPEQLREGINQGVEMAKGMKTNKNKPQLSLLFRQFPQALEAIARCSEYGHLKYKEADSDYLNYQRVEGGSKTYADAGLRHRIEQGNDLESGLPHQYHVAWNALAELQLWIMENEIK